MKKVTIFIQVQETSFLVAELISKEIKLQSIGKTLILLGCSAIVRTMYGINAEAEIKKISLSNDVEQG